MPDSKVVINQINKGTDGSKFGHVWVVVTDSKGVDHSYGFGPNDILVDLPIFGEILAPWSEGKVETKDNTLHPNPDFSKEYSISDAQVQKIINFAEKVKANPGPYNLEGMNNCTTFATKVLVNAGVVPSGGMLPAIPSMIPNWVRAKGIQSGNIKRIASGPRVLRIPAGGIGGIGGGWGASGMGGGAGNAGSAGTRPPVRDPLAIDLDGDGIETTSSRDGTIILFDHNNDGIKTGSGWIKPDDGWLAIDKNGNGTIDSGRELLGVDTLKKNGEFAQNGFDALSDLDANGDGKIDADDTEFKNLRVWRDLNQDGVSQTGELSTLAEIGVFSINVSSIGGRLDLGNGNVQTATGTFTRTSGSAGQLSETTSAVANLDLLVDTFYRKFVDAIPLTSQAESLPDLFGSGRVRNLRESISLSPRLGDFVQIYSNVTTRSLQIDYLDQFIQLWADTSDMKSYRQQALDLSESGVSLSYHLATYLPGNADYESFMRKLGVVERFMGFSYGGPTGEARFEHLTPSSGALSVTLTGAQIASIELAYDRLKSDIYESLLPQTRMRGYLDIMDSSIIEGDFSNEKIEGRFLAEINQKGREGIVDLLEFVSSVGSKSLLEMGWDAKIFIFKQLMSFSSSQVESFSQEMTEWTFKFNEVTQSSTQSSKRNDILIRNILSELVRGDDGDDFILTGNGNDSLFGENGNDFLWGGSGDDIMSGGSGDNVYAWGLGSGKDRIESYNETVDHVDRLLILGSLVSTDLTFRRIGSDLQISIIGNNDSLRIKNAFNNLDDSNWNSMIGEIMFSNGSSMNANDIQALSLIGNSQKDYLRGFIGNDVLNGFDGDDLLEGAAGDDFLIGGLGNDVLKGETGNDFYQFELNWGADTVIDLTGKSIIRFGAGIGRDNLSITREGDDVTITDARNNSSIFFTAYSRAGDQAYLNSEIQFDNGDKLTLRDFLIAKLTCTNGNDTIRGTSLDDTIVGLRGNDTLVGNVGDDFLQGDPGDDFLDGGEGNDTMFGGSGNEILLGGSGNDTYRFGRNQGSDFVIDRTAGVGVGGEDKIVLDADVLPVNVSLYRTSSVNSAYYNANNVDDLILVIDGSNEQLCIADYFSTTEDMAVESIVFGNGGVWTKADILTKLINQSGTLSNFTATTGDDTFTVDHSLDQVSGERGGHDRIESSVSYELPNNLVADIELSGVLNLNAASWGSGAITGNSGDNILRKNGLGNFYYDHATLTGGKGNDLYFARGFMDRNGAKLDEINADKIIDTVIENANEGYDTITTTAYNATLPANVEKLVVSGEGMYAWYFPTSTYIVNHFNGNELDNVIDASGISSGNPIINRRRRQ